MKKRMSLASRILWGMVIGVIAALATLAIGHFYPPFLAFMQKVSTALFDPFGQVFLRMLFFVVIPLVFASLASGVCQLGRPGKLGPLAARTFALFFANMLIGVAIGLVVMNVVNPGGRMSEESTTRLLSEFGGTAKAAIETHAEQPALSLATLVEMFMPRNLVGAVAGFSRTTIGDVLPLILFAILVGVAVMQMEEQRQQRIRAGLDDMAEVMIRIVDMALQLAPYAVPAMIYSVIVKVGLDVLFSLSVFVAACIAALALHLFGTMSVWLLTIGKRSPLKFFAQIRPVLVTGFSTSSSNATLPTSLAVANEDLKLRHSTSGFVLPLGATMNMSGTALFEGCTVLFIAQIFGIDLSLAQQVVLMLLAVLSAVAVAGIPGGSLPLIAGLLASFGIPPEGIGIIIGVDRILDMARTTVNVGADITVAALVDDQITRAEARAASRG